MQTKQPSRRTLLPLRSTDHTGTLAGMSANDLVLCAACNAQVAADATTCPACAQPVLLQDRYRLRSVVGQGAVGITYRADDVRTGAVVAIKEMPLRHTLDSDVRARMEREARVLSELSHDRIPEYVDQFVAGAGKHRAFYLVQGFVDGVTLEQEMARRRYTEAEVVAILDEVLAVLEYLHGLAPPVIHRDLKPGNVARRRTDGRLVLLDFGAVRDVLKDPTVGGSTVAGTYGFMAPEQFRGEATPRTDLYAVGVLAVVLLSRRTPLEMVRPDHSLDWEGSTEHVSPRLRALLGRLLKADPRERPASAATVRGELRRILEPEPDPAPRPVPEPARFGQLPLPEPVPDPGQMYMEIGGRRVPITSTMRKQLGARSKKIAVLLALIGCWIGLHHWYLGRPFWGILSALFAWTPLPAIVSLVQAAQMFFMPQREFDERYNQALLELARSDTRDLAFQIRELHQLVRDGALTHDEFEREKARLLGRQPSGGKLLRGLDQPAVQHLARHLDSLRELPERILSELDEARRRNRRDKNKKGGRGGQQLLE